MGGHPQQQENTRAHTPAEFNQLGPILLKKKNKIIIKIQDDERGRISTIKDFCREV